MTPLPVVSIGVSITVCFPFLVHASAITTEPPSDDDHDTDDAREGEDNCAGDEEWPEELPLVGTVGSEGDEATDPEECEKCCEGAGGGE